MYCTKCRSYNSNSKFVNSTEDTAGEGNCHPVGFTEATSPANPMVVEAYHQGVLLQNIRDELKLLNKHIVNWQGEWRRMHQEKEK